MSETASAESPLSLAEEVCDLAAVARDADDFGLRWEGLDLRVRIIHGSVTSLSFRVPYDAAARGSGGGSYRANELVRAIRPLRIALGVEAPAHVEGKRAGDVEHQTGDARFDDAIYVDAPANDALGAVLGSADVRAAALELVAIGFSITIDDDERFVTATITSFPKPTIESHSHGRRALDAFARLALGLPPVTASGGEHAVDPLAGPTRLFGALGFLAMFGGPILYFGGAGKRCDEDAPMLDCIGPGIFGVVIAVAAVAIVVSIGRARLRVRYGGTSSSSRRIDALVVALAICTFFTVATLGGVAMSRIH